MDIIIFSNEKLQPRLVFHNHRSGDRVGPLKPDDQINKSHRNKNNLT